MRGTFSWVLTELPLDVHLPFLEEQVAPSRLIHPLTASKISLLDPFLPTASTDLAKVRDNMNKIAASYAIGPEELYDLCFMDSPGNRPGSASIQESHIPICAFPRPMSCLFLFLIFIRRPRNSQQQQAKFFFEDIILQHMDSTLPSYATKFLAHSSIQGFRCSRAYWDEYTAETAFTVNDARTTTRECRRAGRGSRQREWRDDPK